MKNKFYVRYVEDSECKLMEFSSLEKMNSFIAKFALTIDPAIGNWIDFTFTGKILLLDESNQTLIKENK